MENEINNIETAESERLLSGNVVKPHIYGAKEPVCVIGKKKPYILFGKNLLSFIIYPLNKFLISQCKNGRESCNQYKVGSFQ